MAYRNLRIQWIKQIWEFTKRNGLNIIITFVSTIILTLVIKILSFRPELLVSIVNYCVIFLLLLLSAIIIAMHNDMEKKYKSNKLSDMAQSFGVKDITDRWKNFFGLEGSFGAEIEERLKNMKGPATWYILTINPEGFLSDKWIDIFKHGVEENGITVKWIFHTPDNIKNNPTLQVQWEMHHPKNYWIKGSEDEMKTLASNITQLKETVKNSNIGTKNNKYVGHWELFESNVAHLYMAFLSVPGKEKKINLLESAPKGTFGLIHNYLMYSCGYELRPAMSLETSGSIMDYYYWSIIRLFSEGVEKGYFRSINVEDI